MTRHAFTPPEDDDVLGMLATPAPAPRAAQPPRDLRPVPAITSPPAPPVPAPSAAPRLDAGTPASQPVVDKKSGAGKRVGLYFDNERWLWLKKLSLERATKGLPSDFTSIVIEALDEKYGRL